MGGGKWGSIFNVAVHLALVQDLLDRTDRNRRPGRKDLLDPAVVDGLCEVGHGELVPEIVTVPRDRERQRQNR